MICISYTFYLLTLSFVKIFHLPVWKLNIEPLPESKVMFVSHIVQFWNFCDIFIGSVNYSAVYTCLSFLPSPSRWRGRGKREEDSRIEGEREGEGKRGEKKGENIYINESGHSCGDFPSHLPPTLTQLTWQLFIAIISIKAKIIFNQGCWLALSVLSCGKVSSSSTDAL